VRGLTDPSRKAVTFAPVPPISENRQAEPVPSVRSTLNLIPPAPHSVHARITCQPPTADRPQIDRRLGKDGRRISAGHSHSLCSGS